MDTLLASARSDLRFALEVLLREEPGVTVVGTATGTEGLLALMKSTSPDLVVLDWDLPGRAPADLIAAARALEDPPYILVLGKDGASQQAAQNAGADAFVLRGDRPGELLAAIRHSRSLRTAPSRHFPTKVKGE